MAELVKLKTLIKQVRGVSYTPEDVSPALALGYIPLLTATNITNRNSIDKTDLIYVSEERVKEEQLLIEGDILIAASSGSINVVGKAATFGDDSDTLTFGAFCKVIRPDSKKVNPKYISLFFQTDYYRKRISFLAQGANINNLRNEHIDELEVPLPDLDTQNKIVTILDKANGLVEKREETIAKYDALLRATFLELFGNPISNIKKFPVGTIRNLVDEVKYGTSSPATPSGQYPYLRMNNITYSGYMDYSDLKFIDVVDTQKEKYLVKKDDLLFNRTNSKELVGKTGIYNRDEEMIIAGYLIRVRTNKKANSWYLWGFLNSQYGKQLLQEMCKSIVGMANINAQELQDIKIPIPPIDLQDQYKNYYKKIESIRKKLFDSKLYFNKLSNALSQLAFKGELSFNTAVDLEVLLENDYDFFKANSTVQSIQLLLERLDKNELNDKKIYEEDLYNKAKSFVFGLLQDGKIKQAFDEQSKTLKLALT